MVEKLSETKHLEKAMDAKQGNLVCVLVKRLASSF